MDLNFSRLRYSAKPTVNKDLAYILRRVYFLSAGLLTIINWYTATPESKI